LLTKPAPSEREVRSQVLTVLNTLLKTAVAWVSGRP
jgi:hypothetical protein